MVSGVFIIITLAFSSIISIQILKKKNSLWLSFICAFALNICCLIVFTLTLYYFHEETRIFGIVPLGLEIYIITLPFICWVNLFIIKRKAAKMR